MESLKTRIISSAGLAFNGTTGEVFSLHKPDSPSHRLSPVNKRVLLSLIQQPGQVISRQALFEQVWPNQMVSDDALTRAIADLRAQLKPLTNTSPLIETIPKTGYRWVHEAELTPSKPNGNPSVKNQTSMRHKIISVVFGLLLGLLLVMVAIQWLVRDIRPNITPLVILPANSQGPVPLNVQSELMKSVHQFDDLAYLSSHAIQAHKGSPFPYFNLNYRVRWFIESQWSSDSGKTQLTLRLIDAKTGLVSHSASQIIQNPTQAKHMCEDFVLFVSDL